MAPRFRPFLRHSRGQQPTSTSSSPTHRSSLRRFCSTHEKSRWFLLSWPRSQERTRISRKGFGVRNTGGTSLQSSVSKGPTFATNGLKVTPNGDSTISYVRLTSYEPKSEAFLGDPRVGPSEPYKGLRGWLDCSNSDDTLPTVQATSFWFPSSGKWFNEISQASSPCSLSLFP